jgi:chloramphenicol O-acetyltransferase type A
MPTLLDLSRWPRRQAFDHYRRFEQPFFGVCTRLDVARLEARVQERRQGSLTLACYFIALQLANQIEPFRYRVAGDQVLVHDALDASTTVLRDDGSLGFATLERQGDFAAFAAAAAPRIQAVRSGQVPFAPDDGERALIYFTTLPWVHFSSFSHARPSGSADSIPRLAFGRIDSDGPRRWMPLAIDAHHALMDGAQVGSFVQRFEAALGEPEGLL